MLGIIQATVLPASWSDTWWQDSSWHCYHLGPEPLMLDACPAAPSTHGAWQAVQGCRDHLCVVPCGGILAPDLLQGCLSL